MKFFFFLTLVLPFSSFAVMEKTVVVNPANAAKYDSQFHVAKSGSEKFMKFTLSGPADPVADVSNDLIVYIAPKRIDAAEVRLLLAPSHLKREIAKNGKKWSSVLEVPSERSNRTYVLIPPPKNMSDGTSYVIDLPAFADRK